ncbi:MAG: PE domain-containing protein [Mycobacterium sp.]
MSYVLAAPELMTAAATDLAAIGSAVDAATWRRQPRRPG